MNILKDVKCSNCGGEIAVIPFREMDIYGRVRTVVDCGRCTNCDKLEILPTEEYTYFVQNFCERR